MKKPEPGSWWESGDYRCYVHAITRQGLAVIEFGDGIACSMPIDSFTNCNRHLPDCTGWDWQPPDWVTQDRVSPRPWIDQVYVGHSVADDKWVVASGEWTLKHGDKYPGSCGTLHVRCLRKDLPPKTPAIGEWWRSKVNGELVLVKAFNQHGMPIIESSNGTVWNVTSLEHNYTHEPNCTGWDWKP